MANNRVFEDPGIGMENSGRRYDSSIAPKRSWLIKECLKELMSSTGYVQVPISLTFVGLFLLWSFSPLILDKGIDKGIPIFTAGSGGEPAERGDISEDEIPGWGIAEQQDAPDPGKVFRPENSSLLKSVTFVSQHLSFYFHPGRGLLAWIITVLFLTVITVFLSYWRFKNYNRRALIADLLFIRWTEFIPQIFIFIIFMKTQDLTRFYVPFLWCLTICWTMAPYFYRQVGPHANSFLEQRVYDAEVVVGEKRRVIFMKYLVWQHCLPIILVLVCYILGSLILMESCMGYLENFRNVSQFKSLGGGLARVFSHLERTGRGGTAIFSNLHGILFLYFIFSGIMCFHVTGKFILIFKRARQRRRWYG